MNTYKPPLTYKKSPIKKLSTAGGKLASVAASRFLDSTREDARSGDGVAASPHIRDGRQRGNEMAASGTTTPQRQSGVGIRDRISKFDSASKRYAPSAPLQTKAEASESPYPNYRRPPFEMIREHTEKENSPHRTNNVTNNENNVTSINVTSRKYTPKKPIQKLKETLSPAVIKANHEVKEMKQWVQDTFAKHDDGTKHTEEVKRNNEKIFHTPTRPSAKGSPAKEDHIDSPNDTLQSSSNEGKLRKRLQQLEAENEALERRNASLEEKCELLQRENIRLESANSSRGNESNNKRNRDAKKKRRSNEHPLISSPLRLHAQAVHEASESNSFVSVRKDPFPLFCDYLATQNSGIDDGAGTNVHGVHLDTLGALIGQCAENAVAAGAAAARQSEEESDK